MDFYGTFMVKSSTCILEQLSRVKNFVIQLLIRILWFFAGYDIC